jgi:hypothetical protein
MGDLAKGSLPSIRHPERSEAKDSIFPSRRTRAQPKDLVVFADDDRNGFKSLQAKPVCRSVAATPYRTTYLRVQATWVLRLGSLLRRAVTASQRNSCRAQHLAFAQDDGSFLRSGIFAEVSCGETDAIGGARAGLRRPNKPAPDFWPQALRGNLFNFRIMTDRHDELAGDFVVINAVDHAASAKRQAHARVILGAAGHRIAQVEIPILREYQTVGGCFGHAADYPDFPRRAIH